MPIGMSGFLAKNLNDQGKLPEKYADLALISGKGCLYDANGNVLDRDLNTALEIGEKIYLTPSELEAWNTPWSLEFKFTSIGKSSSKTCYLFYPNAADATTKGVVINNTRILWNSGGYQLGAVTQNVRMEHTISIVNDPSVDYWNITGVRTEGGKWNYQAPKDIYISDTIRPCFTVSIDSYYDPILIPKDIVFKYAGNTIFQQK